MTQEEKELLLKDLCARLPYRVKVKTPYNVAEFIGIVDRKGVRKDIDYTDIVTDKQTYPLRYCQPYLRPMSSMTKKEEIEYDATFATIEINGHYDSTMTYKSFDFLNAHHFDYRGLIGLKLALEAPEDMYKNLIK